MANLTKEDDTAGGETDDKHEGEPTQAAMIGAGSTDARTIATAAFGTGDVRIPAELIMSGDSYDVTQAYTRMNAIFGMTRENYYSQASAAMQTRKNRLGLKQQLASDISQLVEEPKKALKAMET